VPIALAAPGETALPAVRDTSRLTEEARFEQIYAEEFAFVWRCLRSLGVRDGELDDAAQEVFVAVHRGLSSFRADATIRTWLFGIVRNVAFKQRRRFARKPPGTDAAPPDPPAPGASPLERAQEQEAARFVRAFLARQNEKKREVFVLAVLEGMNIPDVAEALSIPLNTAYTRLRSVRTDFHKALARRREGDDRS
jgi:RNA polymerase sigma-70 factor (ECF subfamily)